MLYEVITLLGNLHDFLPERDAVPYDRMEEMDRHAVVLFHRLAGKVRKGYENYEFHAIFHSVNNFCSVDMSSFYLVITSYSIHYTKLYD